MKQKLFLLTVVAWLGYGYAAENLDLEALQRTIKAKGYNWAAGKTSVSELPIEEQKRLCGLKPIPFNEIADRIKEMPEITPPSSFDWRDEGGYNWTTSAKSQGNCGSCWAFAVIAPFETVLKIAFNKPDTNIDLSEQFLVSCDPRNNGCYGGTMSYAARFLEETGAPDEKCFRYRAQQLPCSDRCSDWKSRVETIDDWGGVVGMNDLKNAIMDYGPLGAGMLVYQDFMSYTGGVYRHTSGGALGYHGISIFGWDDSENCWIGKNSWGKGWGEDGWFRIVYGECGIFNPNLSPGIWLERVSTTKPYIRIWEYEVKEPRDNIWDPGESASIVLVLTNRGLAATNVKGVLSTTDPNIEITDNTSEFGSISLKGISDNPEDPYKVTASSNTPEQYDVPFTLHITADNGYARDVVFKVHIGIRPGEVKDDFPGPNPDTGLLYGLAYDGENLWASEWYSRVIYKLDPKTGKVIGQIPTPERQDQCVDIDFDGDNGVLWVQNNKTKKIYKVNPANGSVITSFNSPANTYPTGLAFDGEHLWIGDRDAYKIYKITTSGKVVSSFTVPISPRPDYGPRGLAFEPNGPDGGSLLLVMTHFNESRGTLDSTVLYEIKMDGSLVRGHYFHLPPSNGRAVEVNPNTGEYWLNSNRPTLIHKVTGFYRVIGIEEPATHQRIDHLSLNISPNPSRNRIFVNLHIPEAKEVSIDVYDIAGKRVHRLADGVFQPGDHILTWNGRDEQGKGVPYGIYFLRLESEGLTCVEKVILMR